MDLKRVSLCSFATKSSEGYTYTSKGAIIAIIAIIVIIAIIAIISNSNIHLRKFARKQFVSSGKPTSINNGWR